MLLALLSVFMLQNTQPVEVTYFGCEGEAPLAAALLITVAAGLLIVREAGGFVTDPYGAESAMHDAGPNDIVAANPHMHARLREVVAEGVTAAEGRTG